MSENSSGNTIEVQCCVVGGGPAGMMLGYLLGRAGVHTVVLEKHGDFFRDFRGDTVHPSTLQVMDELGLIDEFLTLPHQKLQHLDGQFGGRTLRIGDFSRLRLRHPFIAFMPQWDFLNFLAAKAKRYPSLQVMMQSEAVDLLRDGDTVIGVQATTPSGPLTIKAGLTVACDGRHSDVRARANLPQEDIGAPIDVLWFKAGKRSGETESVLARVEIGKMMVTLDRGDYWQCAYVIPKGEFANVQARGLPAFRADVEKIAPMLRDQLDGVASWDDVKLLTVTIDRLKKWTLPGLLCIGDAAHAMSPVGGVGVNLAVQDAVATANLLAVKLRYGVPSEPELDEVRQRRLFPVRMIQAMQVQVQNRIINPALHAGDGPMPVPLPIRLIAAVPWLQGLAARFVGVGVRPEHVKSPEVKPQ